MLDYLILHFTWWISISCHACLMNIHCTVIEFLIYDLIIAINYNSLFYNFIRVDFFYFEVVFSKENNVLIMIKIFLNESVQMNRKKIYCTSGNLQQSKEVWKMFQQLQCLLFKRFSVYVLMSKSCQFK